MLLKIPGRLLSWRFFTGGVYATLADATSAHGVGLVEVYDLDSAATTRLANISTRGFVQTADNVMIGGFALGGSSINPARIVVRAIGPSLAPSRESQSA